jgi:hypothetical protein
LAVAVAVAARGRGEGETGKGRRKERVGGEGMEGTATRIWRSLDVLVLELGRGS